MRTLIFVIALFLIKIQLYAVSPDSLKYGTFGKILIYKPVGIPKSVVLFVSGEDGWNKGVTDMAKNIVQQGALVAGIDARRYMRNLNNLSRKCYYPASDFEILSMALQKKYKMTQYYKPVLIGYSCGATLVYGILAQAPGNTFKGAIALGFSPDLEMIKPLCNGTGLSSHILQDEKTVRLEASKKLTAPFIALAGMQDLVCSYTEIQKYIQEIPNGELVLLPKVGHSFSGIRHWLPQFIMAYNKILQAPSFAEQKALQNNLLQQQHIVPLPGDLPVTLIPAAIDDTLPLAFIISGDGGWTSFDQSLAEVLADKGIPVAGLDAQKYFWNEKKPEEATTDITKAIEHFMQQWHKKTFILIGYSFGASIIPFVANRLSVSLKESMLGVYSLSPDEKADFEIHISDMLDIDNSEDNYNVPNELKKIKTPTPVCIFGDEEDMTTRENFSKTGAKILTLPGSHHYNNNFAAIEELIRKNFLKK